MSSWGRNVEQKSVGTYGIKILHPRPLHLACILTEAQKWGEREFIVFDRRRISFRQFLSASGHAAERLRAAGIAPGDVVVLEGANSPEWMLVFWGLVRIGAVVAQGNAWWSADETAAAVRTLNARFVVADEKRRALLGGCAGPLTVLAIEEFETCFGMKPEDAVPAVPAVPAADEEQPAVLIFTSGTTGKPKAAILSHRAVIACLHNIYAHRGRLPHEMTPADAQMSLFCCNPLFHVGGLLLQLQTLLSGHRLVLLKGRASGETMIDLIERERVNIWATVPTLLSRVIEQAGERGTTLPSVIGISASGSMVGPELMQRAATVFPAARNNPGSTYGMTEAGGSVTMIGGADYLAHPGSAGRPFPTCELRIDAPHAGGEGEILIRTPSAMSAYWGHEDQIIDADGWIHSGDLGRVDGDGYLYVTGRTKDIIIRGGENISAAVVEQRLCEHPAVLEVAVVGLPHADLGEEVGAAVVLRREASITTKELAAFVGSSLAYFQVPSRWWLREDPLPNNAAGKVIKHLLRASWPLEQ
jgi:long-chain acyl-CoA synthetase